MKGSCKKGAPSLELAAQAAVDQNGKEHCSRFEALTPWETTINCKGCRSGREGLMVRAQQVQAAEEFSRKGF